MITNRLVDNWKRVHKMWSVRFMAFLAMLPSLFAYFPDAATGVLNSLPPEMRMAVPGSLTLVLIAIGIFVRLWQQKPKEPPHA
jgi:hypothetical protein